MTDDQRATAPPSTGEPFVIIPTLDGFLALEHRVKLLEQRPVPAVSELVQLEAVPDDFRERLGRHRREIEALKEWCNGVARFLDGMASSQPAPPAPPAPTPGEFL